MPIINRHLLLCTSDNATRSMLEEIARELSVGSVIVSDPMSANWADVDCAVIEFRELGPDSFRLLDTYGQIAPGTPVIAVLHQASPTDAIRFSRRYGTFECLGTSSSKEEFFTTIRSALRQVRRERESAPPVSKEPWRQQLIGSSFPMDQVIRIIRLVASRRCTVLITGETGTGKEMAARAIHLASNRAHKPMVCVNCSAIPENLVEAELFGHVKGAYTGAVNSRTGRFEQASGGTLFLDEIADLPFELQSKLLRALQEKEIQRLGGTETVKVDVRVIAATNADLLTRVQEGRFREDLYYRLNVVPIRMPALRERLSDIGPLVQHFIQKVCSLEGIPLKSLATGGLSSLAAYHWPGNVRQLENVVEHAVVMSGEREYLQASDFVLPKSAALASASEVFSRPVAPAAASGSELPEEGLDFTETLRQFERAILQQALTRAQGNKTLAADMLRLPRTTLIHKLRALEQPTV